jgi:hypothetical protein
MIGWSSCHCCSPFSYLHLDALYTFTQNQAFFKTIIVVKTLTYYHYNVLNYGTEDKK